MVAFSGGVDSTLVAAVATRALGDKALAITGKSASLPKSECEAAKNLSKKIGIRHQFIDTDEIKRPDYVANAGNRCYHCKSELYEHLEPIAAEQNAIIVNGTNKDDLEDVRPGLIAASEHGVRSPLVEASLGKDDVRAISKLLDLPNWDKPAMACLASRIPVGTEVSIDLLNNIENAESYIRALGVDVLRVRHHGTVARIEVDESGLSIVFRHKLQITKRLKQLGYRFITVDLDGYRSGSLNPRNPLEDCQPRKVIQTDRKHNS